MSLQDKSAATLQRECEELAEKIKRRTDQINHLLEVAADLEACSRRDEAKIKDREHQLLLRNPQNILIQI